MLFKGIDTGNKWVGLLGRRLDECNRLPGIFHTNGLESIHQDLIGSDSYLITRRKFSVELTTAFLPKFVKFAEMEGSGTSVEKSYWIE